jgi:hypothetical protein
VTNCFAWPQGEISGTSLIGLRLLYHLISESNGASFEHAALDLQFQKKPSSFRFFNAAETYYTNLLLNFRSV